MKLTKLHLANLLVPILLVSCILAATSGTQTSTPVPSTEATSSVLLTQGSPAVEHLSIEPYQDVRFKIVPQLEDTQQKTMIETLWFNEATTWSKQNQQVAQNILKLGMNPGLGVRDLHAKGITGKGVNVAIIDQNLLLDHPEFEGKIVKYYDVGTEIPSDKGSMHGPAVTSLLVGENIGTAPGARVYYVATPSWLLDARYDAEALNWIIDLNAQLPEADKIQVVSVSAAPSGLESPYKNREAWEAAYHRAMDVGILVLDCTIEHRIIAPCYYDLDNQEDVTKCMPGWPSNRSYKSQDNYIYIPAARRTTAEEYKLGNFSYQYDGQGGLSWSVPYLAGVLALGWQVNPEASSSQLLDMLYASAYVNEENAKIINPTAFIEMVQDATSK